ERPQPETDEEHARDHSYISRELHEASFGCASSHCFHVISPLRSSVHNAPAASSLPRRPGMGIRRIVLETPRCESHASAASPIVVRSGPPKSAIPFLAG